MKMGYTKALTAFTLLFICVANNASAQNVFPATGRAGIYTTAPAVSLHVKGGARIGTTANYVNIDSATGNLSFNGTSTYKVADNKYAFQSAANPNIGLFFNAASVQYEFRNTSAAPVFYINANTGNGVFKGNLKVGAYTLPATDGANGQSLKTDGAGNISWATVSGGGGANTALSNLAATAVNVSLLPGADSARDLGSALLSWKNIYLKGGLYFNGIKMMQYKPGVNTIVGENAGSTGTGGFNTALGSNVLSNNTFGNSNVAIGENSLVYNTTGNNNTATGYASLINNTSGTDNLANGFQALYNNTTGSGNTAIGKFSLFNSTSANENTAVGSYSLYSNLSGSLNTAIGTYAMQSNTGGAGNTATGNSALYSNMIGFNNSAYGAGALSSSTSDDNSAFGYFSLFSNTKGAGNTAVGKFSLYYNTTAGSNTALGHSSLFLNTTGNNNTALGSSALFSNTTGSENSATGSGALHSNTIANYNTANGTQSLYFNTDGEHNTAVGYYAIKSNVTGNINTANGSYALYSNVNGNSNVASGYKALYGNTSGSGNTSIGTYAFLDNTSGGYNTGIGYNVKVNSTTLLNATAIGTDAIVDASNKVRIGSNGVTSIGGQVGWTTFSDGRYKKNIKQNVQGLAFINSLQPITYTVDINGLNEYYDKGRKHDSSYEKMKATMKESTDKAAKIVYNGFIAQDVEKAAEKLNYNFSGVDKPQSKDGLYGLRYADFVVPLVKAVQELSKENEEQKKINADLQKQIEDLRLLITRNNPQSVNATPTGISLEQNMPNPFNQSATINYALPAKFSSAKIMVTDNNGKTIKQFTLSSSGKGSVSIAAGTLASGLYRYALYVDGKMMDSKKMEIIR